jgi:uncharacterized OB-fold protein
MSSGLPVFDPHPTLETERFWTAAAEGRLVLPKCDNCGNVIWYPRRFCPVCHHARVTWIDASGRGTVYSFTVVRKGRGPWKDSAPYVAAYVELEEGPRVMTNVVEVDPDAVRIGMPVEVVFDRSETAAIPRFRPAG